MPKRETMTAAQRGGDEHASPCDDEATREASLTARHRLEGVDSEIKRKEEADLKLDRALVEGLAVRPAVLHTQRDRMYEPHAGELAGPNRGSQNRQRGMQLHQPPATAAAGHAQRSLEKEREESRTSVAPSALRLMKNARGMPSTCAEQQAQIKKAQQTKSEHSAQAAEAGSAGAMFRSSTSNGHRHGQGRSHTTTARSRVTEDTIRRQQAPERIRWRGGST
jgi:hypothetical protein